MESSSSDSIITPSSLQDLTDVRVINSFHSISDLYAHLDSLNLLDPENLRPGWDAYFMVRFCHVWIDTVSCIFTDIGFSCISTIELYETPCWSSPCTGQPCPFYGVRNSSYQLDHVLVILNRYNGTARGLSNCNQGGCRHCNGTTLSVGIPYECVCLHAEENALLEAGRERIGQNAVLYCNTLVNSDYTSSFGLIPLPASCPCLRCTVKIIQTGVKTVVYNLTYKVSVAMFEYHVLVAPGLLHIKG